LQEVLDETETKSCLPDGLQKKKKFFESKDDLCIMEHPAKIQQNDNNCAFSQGKKKLKVQRPHISNIISKNWSVGEETLFYQS
jgi:hypothetical protein